MNMTDTPSVWSTIRSSQPWKKGERSWTSCGFRGEAEAGDHHEKAGPGEFGTAEGQVQPDLQRVPEELGALPRPAQDLHRERRLVLREDDVHGAEAALVDGPCLGLRDNALNLAAR